MIESQAYDPATLGAPAGIATIEALQYGENPPQAPAYFRGYDTASNDPLAIGNFEVLDGLDGAHKLPRSYVGITDLDRVVESAVRIAAGYQVNFQETPFIALAVKHGNACGSGVVAASSEVVVERILEDDSLEPAVDGMIDGDNRAIHGSLMLINGIVDEAVAERLLHYNTPDGKNRLIDGIAASGFTLEARQLLSRQKTRLMQNPALADLSVDSLYAGLSVRPVRHGDLIQPSNTFVQDFGHPEMIFLGDEPSERQKRDMILAWGIGSTSNSNTITLASNDMLIGNGVSQQDRVGAAQLALARTTTQVPKLHSEDGKLVMTFELDQAKIDGASGSSDSFFSHADAPTLLYDAGVKSMLTTYRSDAHLNILEELVGRGAQFSVMPDTIARGFVRH